MVGKPETSAVGKATGNWLAPLLAICWETPAATSVKVAVEPVPFCWNSSGVIQPEPLAGTVA